MRFKENVVFKDGDIANTIKIFKENSQRIMWTIKRFTVRKNWVSSGSKSKRTD